MPSSSKIAALTRLLKDNVALIVVLEARETKIGGDMQGAPGKHGQLLCVVSGDQPFSTKGYRREMFVEHMAT
jgi:CCR4-NOT transcription complex subunit 6